MLPPLHPATKDKDETHPWEELYIATSGALT
jgi:hypothetical protein